MDLAAIAADRTHGASYLTAQAAEVLLATVEAGGDIEAAAVDVMLAQPAMASMMSLANAVLSARDKKRVLREWIDHWQDRIEAAGELAAGLVRDDAVVLTHSHSRCVACVLRIARARGSSFQVIVTESRPLREGVTFARVLADQGIAVRVIADAAMYRHMPEANLVLVGADAVTPRGITNKAGTGLAALAAREFGKPVYAVTTSDRFFPVQPMRDVLRPPEEIVPERRAGVSVSNFYFDTTPLEWFAAVISDAGSFDAARVLKRIDRIQVHPVLAAAFQERA